jgi:putative ABC transport system permease protein
MQLSVSQFVWIGERSFSLSDIGWGNILTAGICCTLLLSFMAGFYPAFYLSGFDTVKSLKGHLRHGKTGKSLRNSLVVFQFCISVGMILITLVVAKQLQFLKEKDLGFAKESLLVVQQADLLGNSKAYFKTQVQQLPGVAEVSLSSYTFPNFQRFEDTYQPKESTIKEITLVSLVADHDFITTLGLQLIAGRNFEKANAGDKHSVIISEMAARQIGWQNPVGKTLVYPGFPGEDNSFKVVGVVNNFHHLPMNYSMEPFLLFLPESGHPTDEAAYFLVRLQGNVQQSLAGLEKTWNKAVPGYPLQYTFVDEAFAANYRSYEDMQSLFFLFSGLAIAISCLGLLGLAVFATNTRLKEISIRKVLGAPVSGIIFLLNRELLLLIVIAFLIGAPVGFMLVHKWLQNFAYQTTITLTDILLPGLVVLLIALITVSYISFKAARANPIKSLRNE